MSRRPVPTSYGVVPGSAFADDISASLSRRGDQAGCAAARRAAAPTTCGAAIDVPSIVWYMPSPHGSCCDLAAVTSTPGAARSGLSAWSPVRGPMLENHALWSTPSTAATVSASSAAPGALTVNSEPLFPAAITNRAPSSRVSSSTACDSGSSPSVKSGSPRLMLTTSARAAAHSMPSMIQEDCPKPSSPSTFPTTSSAPGATPLLSPADAAPEPAIVEATWETVTPPRRPAQPLAARFTGGITKLWLDSKVEADLADSVPQVGAPSRPRRPSPSRRSSTRASSNVSAPAHAEHELGPLDDLDSQVLSLLLVGLNDRAIAFHLRTSLRTVQRRVRHLMDRAGARTRTQLGWKAARLGLVSSHAGARGHADRRR
jgi:hypothetical protein